MTSDLNIYARIVELWAEKLHDDIGADDGWKWANIHNVSPSGDGWRNIARTNLSSLGADALNLVHNWSELGRSDDLIFQAVLTIDKAKEYRKKRKEMLDSITDPIMREAARKA